MAELPTHIIAVDTLQRFVAEIFGRAGTSAEEGARIAHHLIGANLTGHDSHGVIRVPRYVQNLQDGDVVANQKVEIVTEGPTHAVIDGHMGFGQTVGPQAVDVGIAKAKQAGMCIIALRNSGHIGRIGDWGERAAEQGLVSLHFVNVYQGQLVAPFVRRGAAVGSGRAAGPARCCRCGHRLHARGVASRTAGRTHSTVSGAASSTRCRIKPLIASRSTCLITPSWRSTPRCSLKVRR